MKPKQRAWVRGLLGAFIGGGFGAVSSGFGSMVIAPEHFNMKNGVGDTIKLMSFCFLVQAIVTMSAYLSKSPLPPENGDTQFFQEPEED